MSVALKKRVLAGVLAILAVWPAVHHLLTRSLELDPWLLLGWSMYTAPDAPVEVRVAEVRGERIVPLELPSDLREKARRYAIMRESLGALARPDRLARRVLARLGPDGIVVGVRRFELDRETARIVTRDRIFRYERDGSLRSENRTR